MKSIEGRRFLRALSPYILITPTVILVLVFIYGIVNGILQGFGIMPFLGMNDFTLEFYLRALQRSDIVDSLGFSLYLSAVSSALAVVGGILLSAAITRLGSGRTLQIVGISIPLMTAHTLVVLFVVSLFSGSGLFVRVLYALGFVDGMGVFSSVVGDPSGWGILLVYSWKEIPFVAFCTITIMSHVSNRYGEAALTLGSSPVRTFFNVTLPLCKGAIIKASLIVFAFSFGAYEVPYLLGPTLPKALPVLAYYEFQNPDILNRCYAMAINGIMVFVCVVIAVIYFIMLQRERKH